MNTIAVIIEGGLVQCVCANSAIPDLQIMVVNYDVDSALAEEVVMVPQSLFDKSTKDAPAYISVHPVLEAHIDLTTTLDRFEKEIHPTEEEFGNV